MNRKLSMLLAALIVQLSLANCANAQAASKGDSDGYLKIFTPYHTIKSVCTEETDRAKPVNLNINNRAFKHQLTEDEIHLMARIVYAESKGEPFIGKIGVASVILNRLKHPLFPKSIKDVIYQKNAFSCINDSSGTINPDIETYKAVEEALKGNDPTDNAVFFYNPDTATSKWMKKTIKTETTRIGNHVFFK